MFIRYSTGKVKCSNSYIGLKFDVWAMGIWMQIYENSLDIQGLHMLRE